MASVHGWPTWSGRRAPASTADRRTVGELLADCDALAHERRGELLEPIEPRDDALRFGAGPLDQMASARDRLSAICIRRSSAGPCAVIWFHARAPVGTLGARPHWKRQGLPWPISTT
jgi:hypothetical protein